MISELIGSVRITTEATNGLLSQVLKDKLFNTPLTTALTPEAARAAVKGIM